MQRKQRIGRDGERNRVYAILVLIFNRQMRRPMNHDVPRGVRKQWNTCCFFALDGKDREGNGWDELKSRWRNYAKQNLMRCFNIWTVKGWLKTLALNKKKGLLQKKKIFNCHGSCCTMGIVRITRRSKMENELKGPVAPAALLGVQHCAKKFKYYEKLRNEDLWAINNTPLLFKIIIIILKINWNFSYYLTLYFFEKIPTGLH